MAKATDKKQVSRVKIKKKTWFRIVAPQLFGQQEVGETFVETPETIIGRKVDVNLKELTNNVKDQSAYVSFRMTKVEGTTVHTEPIGYSLTPSYVKRLVRKNTSRLDDYFVLQTKAGERVVLKTIMVTRSKVQRSVQKALRSTMRSLLQGELRKMDFTGFLALLVSGRLRKTLSSLNKITPLREYTLRVMTLNGMASEPLPEETVDESAAEAEAAEESTDEEEAAEEEQDDEEEETQ
ncbi:hypothetical protein HYT55_04395 [Candidatus Woesearchaeota archaeon]|nr:hypothetical protein [Candidatus Woesearchaeota archaeon]